MKSSESVMSPTVLLLLLIPVIVAEGVLCKKWLGLSTWEAMKSNALSNLASTIVGVPLAWAIMFGVELAAFGIVDRSDAIRNWHRPIAKVIWFFLASAWIGPPRAANVSLIPSAILALLIAFFLVSYLIEYFVVRFMVGASEGDLKVRVAVRNANLVTYGVMFFATTTWLVFAHLHG
jgi:hypothetical protein